MPRSAKGLKRKGAAGEGSGTGSGGLTVLHIEDDPNDSALLRAAARKAGGWYSLQTVEDGEQACAYLSGRGLYAARDKYPLPSLILLDLKMPRSTGFEVLRWIRANPESSHIPVVVLSGSELEDDIKDAYAAGANSYLMKPLGFNELVELVKNINAVWSVMPPGAGQNPRVGAQRV